MKRKLIAIGLCLVMSVTMPACGSTVETSTDLSDASAEELQQVITKEKADDEQENWSDDMVIPFTDPNMLEEVRRITGIQSREITYGDVKNIKEFETSSYYSDITPLKYFTSLRSLIINSPKYDTNLDMLKNLTNLETLTIMDANGIDISGLGNLTNLRELGFWGDMTLTDISALGNLTNLRELGFWGDMTLTDISALGNLTNLESLSLSGKNLTDISVLGNLTNLKDLTLRCTTLTDISVLGNLTNLKSLSLSCENLTDISVLGNLTNLESLGLSCENLTDISVLGNLTNLKDLTLRCTTLTDISVLGNLTNLEFLFLDQMDSLTDFSVLKDLPNLRSVSFDNCNITSDDAGVQDLENAGVHVVF